MLLVISMTHEFLAVHYFHTARMRHWIEQEVFLCPKFLLLKVYASIANIGIDFVPATYPSAGAFGHIGLPAAFIKGFPTGSEGILKYLGSLTATALESGGFNEEKLALSALTESTLSEAIQYNLWGYQECFANFTWPVMLDSMPRPYADRFCKEQVGRWINRDVDLMNRKLESLFKVLSRRMSVSRFLFSQDQPSLTDILVYSHLSVLLSIPDKFSPFFFARDEEALVELVQRLKSYLLDFDDWLWQLNAKRDRLVPSAEVDVGSEADPPNASPVDEPAFSEPRPFLGKDSESRRSNLLFIGLAAAAMATVGYASQ